MKIDGKNIALTSKATGSSIVIQYYEDEDSLDITVFNKETVIAGAVSMKDIIQKLDIPWERVKQLYQDEYEQSIRSMPLSELTAIIANHHTAQRKADGR